MAKYAMSDIHGCYDKFKSMLELINFTNDDELYIVGDIFDRGEKPLKILDYILGHKNIHLIKGNHELMFEDYFVNGDIQLWYYNGGQSTHEEIISREWYYEEQLYNYIRKLPFIKVVDKFILVHAGLYLPSNLNDLTIEELIDLQEEDICLWNRSNIGKERKFKDYTIICGHTPVQSITNNYDDVKILHREGYVYIDCGCVFSNANGKLGCLRLDDIKEFYV